MVTHSPTTTLMPVEKPKPEITQPSQTTAGDPLTPEQCALARELTDGKNAFALEMALGQRGIVWKKLKLTKTNEQWTAASDDKKAAARKQWEAGCVETPVEAPDETTTVVGRGGPARIKSILTTPHFHNSELPCFFVLSFLVVSVLDVTAHSAQLPRKQDRI